MTANVFRANDGKIATYAGPGDAPFTSPITNIAAVGFHSDFNYVTVSHVKTFSNIVLNTEPTSLGRIYTLGTHDAAAGSGVPIILGRLTAISGSNLLAAAPRSLQGACNIDSFHWLSLSYDATNVFLVQQYARPQVGAPSRTVTVEITVLDQRLPA